MFDGRPSARSLGRPRPFIRSVWTFGETASDLMRCGPHHLRVMPNLEQIILRRAVRKVVFFQEPRFRGKHPKAKGEPHSMCYFSYSINQVDSKQNEMK